MIKKYIILKNDVEIILEEYKKNKLKLLLNGTTIAEYKDKEIAIEEFKAIQLRHFKKIINKGEV